MNVADTINALIREKGMTKREFARRLSSLKPRLKHTGTIPSEQTIYGYLNGKREIKVELIPYIADVLEIQVQELFGKRNEYAANHDIRNSAEVREIIDLLHYAPPPLRHEIKELLTKVKDAALEGMEHFSHYETGAL